MGLYFGGPAFWRLPVQINIASLQLLVRVYVYKEDLKTGEGGAEAGAGNRAAAGAIALRPPGCRQVLRPHADRAPVPRLQARAVPDRSCLYLILLDEYTVLFIVLLQQSGIEL